MENTTWCWSLQHHNVHMATQRFHEISEVLILLNLSTCLQNLSADILIFVFIIPFVALVASSSSGGFNGNGCGEGGSPVAAVWRLRGWWKESWRSGKCCWAPSWFLNKKHRVLRAQFKLLTMVPWVPAQVRPGATGSCSHKQFDYD